MKAIVKTSAEAGALAVVDMPKPAPGYGEIVVNMKATGICYTDVSILHGRYKGRRPVPIPLIMGHEGAGVVAELGKGVKNVAVGDRVALEALWGCGRCVQCNDGFKNMCADWEHVGITRHGTFAEYMVLPADLAHPIPASMSFAEAAFMEPISLVVRTLEHAQPLLGDSVAIVGPGSLGMFHLQAFKAAGASRVIVIGMDQDQKRFEIAKQLGADHVVNINRENPVDAVKALTDGLGADIVVETASSDKATTLAIELAAPRGRVVLFGLYPQATIGPVDLLRNGLTVFGDVALVPRQFRRAVNWVKTGKVTTLPMITKRFQLDQAEEAFDYVRRGETVKVLFEI
jgi:threonine dehydrogenase-like Zn-dependent dehydrogenase